MIFIGTIVLLLRACGRCRCKGLCRRLRRCFNDASFNGAFPNNCCIDFGGRFDNEFDDLGDFGVTDAGASLSFQLWGPLDGSYGSQAGLWKYAEDAWVADAFFVVSHQSSRLERLETTWKHRCACDLACRLWHERSRYGERMRTGAQGEDKVEAEVGDVDEGGMSRAPEMMTEGECRES